MLPVLLAGEHPVVSGTMDGDLVIGKVLPDHYAS